MQIKKLMLGIILSLLIGLTLPPQFFAHAAENTEYLVTPTDIAVVHDSLFIYDQNSSKIVKYSNGLRGLSIEVDGVKKLTTNGTDLFALTTTGIAKIDTELSQKSDLVFYPTSYPKSDIIDFTLDSDSFYALTNDGKIDEFSLSDNTLTWDTTLPKDYLSSIQEADISLTTIELVEDKLHLTTSKISFNLDPTTKTVTEKYNTTDSSTIVKTDKQYSLTSSNCIIDTNNSTHFDTLCDLNISGFTSTSDTLYLLDATTHKVYSYNTVSGTRTDLNLNPEISVTKFDTLSFKHLKLKESAQFFMQPYSVTPIKTLDANSYINVIGEYLNFYYCLVTDGKTNMLLYLNKSTESEELDLGNTKREFYTTRNIKIFSMPTTVEDKNNINSVLSTIQAGTLITTETSSTLVNTNGDLFYITKVENDYGFIRSNFLQSTKGTVQLTNDCNAKVKRDTTLFENADGTGEILTLKKSARITLLDDPAPNKTYLKAEYQDSNGVIYTGYVYTEDIKKDGLSTLQILGLVLIVANITVLSLIIIIKKRSAKWKIKEQTKPHHLDL